MYEIEYAKSVANDLAALRAYDRTRTLNDIERHLTHQPTVETRNRKIVLGLVPPWEHEEPIWELRIGEHRVFYDVDDQASAVVIRAVRHKPPHKTTEEIL